MTNLTIPPLASKDVQALGGFFTANQS